MSELQRVIAAIVFFLSAAGVTAAQPAERPNVMRDRLDRWESSLAEPVWPSNRRMRPARQPEVTTFV